MKLGKKFFALALAAVMTVGGAVSVMAAGSAAKDVKAVDIEDENNAIIVEALDTTGLPSDVADAVTKVNAGELDAAGLAELISEADVKAALQESTLITEVFDLEKIGEPAKNANGKYSVSLQVSTLTSDMTDVQLLHYSTERGVWEVIPASSIDYATKTIVVELQDVSPGAIIAKVSTKTDSTTSDTTSTTTSSTSSTTSPKTGVASVWMMYLAAALVLTAAGCVVLKKRNA